MFFIFKLFKIENLLVKMDLFERNILIGEDDELAKIILIVYGIPRRIYNSSEYFHSFDELTFLRIFRVTKKHSPIYFK